MNQNGFFQKVAAVTLSLAMALSMAAPMTVLAEAPEQGGITVRTEGVVQDTKTSDEDTVKEPDATGEDTGKEPNAAGDDTGKEPDAAGDDTAQEPTTPQVQGGEIMLFGLPAPREAYGDITQYLTKDESGKDVSKVTVTPAGTEEVKPFDSNTVLNYNDKFNIALDWKFPDTLTINNGDTFTYQLPGNLDYGDDAHGTLSNNDGNTVGSFEIIKGLVTITYTKDMGSSVHGTLDIHGLVDKAGLGDDDGGNKTFNFPGICDETVLVNRNTENDNLSVKKNMTVANQNDPYLQNVVITVDAKGPQPNVDITDVMGDFLKYKDGTFAVYSDSSCTVPYTGSFTGSSYDHVHFTELKDETVYIKYQVEVDKKLSGYNCDQWDFNKNNNTVSATTEGKDNTPSDDTFKATARVDNTWKVDKNGNYDATSGKATWTITIDPGNDTTIDGTKIKELLGTDIGTPESVTLHTATRGTEFSGDGSDISGDWGKLVDGSYVLNGTNKKFQITVVTPLTSVPTAGQKNYTNNVEVTPYGDGDVKRGTGTIGVGEQFDALDKVCTTESTSASELEWKTTVKAPASGLTNAIVSDTVGSGHTLVYGTEGNGITVTGRDGVTVPAYTIEQKNKDGNVDTNSFTITFNEKIPANAVLDITYKTNVTATGEVWPSNTAYLNADELGVDNWTTETANHHFTVHLEKWGKNAENGKFTWNAILKNFKAGDIKDSTTITVVDTLPENNTFVEGSISVTELWMTTAYDGVTAAVSDDKKTVTFTVGGTALDALRAGKNINIQYNTILTNPALVTTWTNYTNTVKAVVDGVDSNTVTANGGTDKPKVLTKTVNYSDKTGGRADYAIDINPSGLDLVQGSDSITLKDTMGTGLQLMANTIRVSADGGDHYTPIGSMGEGYGVNYNADTHIMELVLPDSTPLKLRYSVLVALEIGTAFTQANGGNKIELTGDNSYQNDSSSNLTGVVVKPAGTSESIGCSIKVYKYEDGNISKPLSGAEFTVQKVNLNETIAAGTTAYTIDTETPYTDVAGGASLASGSDGYTPSVGGLVKDAIYCITETKAPDGFAIGTPYYVVFPGNTGVDWAHATLKFGDLGCIINAAPDGTASFAYYADNKPVPTTSIKVTKHWNDNGNEENKRPAITSNEAKELMFLLKAIDFGGIPSIPERLTFPPTTIVDNNNNTWTYTWNDLPAADNDGHAITYTVAEDATKAPDYAGPATAVGDKGAITNTYPKPLDNTTSVSITKIWVDNNNAGRPKYDSDAAKAMMTLYKGLEKVDQVPDITDNGDGTWTFTWTGLPEKDDGFPIIYTIKEESIPTGYSSSMPVDGVGNGGSITNTLATVDFHITKAWDDAGNASGIRPTSNSDVAKKMMALYNGTTEITAGTLTITDSGSNNWTYTWSGLPALAPGESYTVKETGTPTGYTASTNDAVASGETITNTLDAGKISVTKVDADETGTILANAKFGIYTDADATKPAKDITGKVATITTTATGRDLSADLPVGTYYVKETTAPSAEYSLNPTVFPVEVTDDNVTPVKTGANAYVTDSKKAGQIIVTKVDSVDTAQKLPDAVFGVYESEADANAGAKVVTTIKTLDNGSGTSIKLPVGSTGSRTYYVKETKAPTGYNLNSTVFPVVVTENGFAPVKTDNSDAKQYVADVKIKGNISVTKVDAAYPTILLAGAIFGVYTEAGADIPAMVDGKAVTITTDAEGKGSSAELPYGTYYVKELTAPDTYDVNPNIFKVQVTAGTTAVKTSAEKPYVADTKTVHYGSATITKHSVTLNGEKLQGCSYVLYREVGTQKEYWTAANYWTANQTDATKLTTGSDGTATATGLPVGLYHFLEVDPPKGYLIDTDPIDVVIDETNATTEAEGAVVHQADQKKPSHTPDEPTPTPAPTPTPYEPTYTPTPTPTPVVHVPRTADNSQPLLYVLAMAAALCGLGGLALVKRRKH